MARPGMMSTAALICGLSLFLLGVATASPSSARYAGSAPDYQAWFTILTGLVTVMVGSYAKGLSGRINGHDNDLRDLREKLARQELVMATEHHTKEEANGQFNRLEDSIKAIHRRLDYLKVPSAFNID